MTLFHQFSSLKDSAVSSSRYVLSVGEVLCLIALYVAEEEPFTCFCLYPVWTLHRPCLPADRVPVGPFSNKLFT